jgi:hypothetical protein
MGSATRTSEMTRPGRSTRRRVRHPRLRVWVACRADLRLHPAGRAIAGEHVEEHVLGEVGQLVEQHLRDLRALPVVDVVVVLEVRHLHAGRAPPVPLEIADVRLPTQQRVDLPAVVPQTARVLDLLRGAAKEDGRVVGHVQPSRGRQQRGIRLSASRRPAADRDVRLRADEASLKARLCLEPNRLRRRRRRAHRVRSHRQAAPAAPACDQAAPRSVR